MQRFEEVLPGVHLLKVPFSTVRTGVVFVRGEKSVLIDSSQAQPDEFVVPALADVARQLVERSKA